MSDLPDHRNPHRAKHRASGTRNFPAPRVEVGEVAYLEVVTVNDTGAFLDWGHPKDLLLPYGEQHFRPSVGKRVLVKVYEDQLGRPVASQRLDRFLEDEAVDLSAGEKVDLMVADPTDLGFKVVVNHRFWGLLYQDDVTRPLRRGQRLGGHVKRLRDDRRLDISLLPPGPARLDVVGEEILRTLRESGGYLPLSDKSSPAEIKARLRISKSAFKQAIGRLYKQGHIILEPTGIRLAA